MRWFDMAPRYNHVGPIAKRLRSFRGSRRRLREWRVDIAQTREISAEKTAQTLHCA
jgi:hypothetical protein